MSREIKFRAWDEEAGEWHDDTHLSMTFYGAVIQTMWHEVEDMSGLVPMQYTGLRDKNGVEVYESDIVEVIDYRFVQRETTRKIVLFEDGAFMPVALFPGGYYEVVGNVYETPELLKEVV